MNSPRCYSYIRFSTPEQAKGHSVTRQMEQAKEYAEKHNLLLDENLSFQDSGISAFHGDNRKKGALGQFLECVKNGNVPKDSVLIVESFDRLSREKVLEALTVFIEIIQNGIKVVTLTDGMEYTRDSVNDNFSQLLISLMIMSRAHEESLIKSQRLSAVWEHKRNNVSSKKITGKCPAWLELNDDKTEFFMIPDRCESVKQIFIKKDEGKGKTLIAKELNQSNLWKPENGWRESYIDKILRSRAVIGEYQPHKFIDGKRQPYGEPIKEYFPKIVDEKLFYRIQNSLKNNKNCGGRGGKISNLFSYIAKCGYCGSPMAFLNKGYGEYLICDNKRRGFDCIGHTIEYKQFEKMILAHTKGLDIAHILNTKNESIIQQINNIDKQLESIEGEKRHIAERIDNLTKAISMTPYRNVQQECEKILNEFLEKKDLLEKEQEDIKRKKKEFVSKIEAVDSHLQINELIDEIENSDSERRVVLRLKLRKALRSIYDFIDVYSGGDNVFEEETIDEKIYRIQTLNDHILSREYIEKHLDDFEKPEYCLMYRNGSFMVLQSNREQPLETEFDSDKDSLQKWIHGENGNYLQIGDKCNITSS